MNQVLLTTRYVIENSKHVKIDQGKIEEFCNSYKGLTMEHWLKDAPFDLSKLENEERLTYLLVFNSVNFSYWGDPKWTVLYRGAEYDGAWGMIVTLGRAIENGIPILDPAYLANMSQGNFREIFRGNVDIPLADTRLEILREVGKVLNERFQGKSYRIMEEAGYDALKLVDLLTGCFPSFGDHSLYDDQIIYFNKRAQLLVSDIYHVFDGKGLGEIGNTDRLTAFADYKIPQSLRKLGIHLYSDDLGSRVDSMSPIPKGSEEEVEIRANTIWAIEFIRRSLQERNIELSSILINDYLWLMGQKKSPDDKPYHRTRTTAY